MSFIHSTIVGHFDPETLTPRNRRTIRPLDFVAARTLLAEFPANVASRVEFCDAYVECWWADGTGFAAETQTFAYRLAELQNCVAAETPVCVVTYPEEAKRLQIAAWDRWREQNPSPPRPPPPEPIFNPPPPVPCPYCGELLRTAIARRRRHCKMDWHDPENVLRRPISTRI
jgi:hypothetical protein